MLFKYPSASLRRRGRATFPRAHCSYRGRSARISRHLEGEIKVEEPATIAVEYRIASRCALPIKYYGNLWAEHETVGWYPRRKAVNPPFAPARAPGRLRRRVEDVGEVV